MLRSLQDLRRYRIQALDGEIGAVDDVLFDDRRHVVRYFVVDTGHWLPGRRVLISPVSVIGIDWGGHRIAVELTRAEVRESPDIDTDLPVSRQQEILVAAHYGYGPYWAGGGLWGAAMSPRAFAPGVRPASPEADAATAGADDREPGDPHLRSAREVKGYHLRATDGDIGHVDDFIVNDESWALRDLIVDTSNWPGGRTVVVPMAWVARIEWDVARVFLDRATAEVRDCPEYDRALLRRQ